MNEFVRHFREVDGNGDIKAKGGATVGIVESDFDLKWGLSTCCEQDNFTKHLGYVKAIGRAKSKQALVTPKLSRGKIDRVLNYVEHYIPSDLHIGVLKSAIKESC